MRSFAVILESFDGEAPRRKVFSESAARFIRAVSGAGLCRVRIPPLSAFNTRRRLSVKGAANELCRKYLRMKLGGTTIISSHRIILSYGIFLLRKRVMIL